VKQDAPMKPLVDFFIVGTQKGGTTALDTYLRQHHQIDMAKVKEVHFFDNEKLDWEKPDYTILESFFDSPHDCEVCRGESTPIYMYWPLSMERLKKYNPAARIIVCLRHPAMRAHSHWRMSFCNKHEMLSFEEAISSRGMDRIVDLRKIENRLFSYIARGFYSQQIERILRLFARDQVFFLRTDDLWLYKGEILNEVMDFLGVPRCPLHTDAKYIVPVNSLHVAQLDRDVYRNLLNLYADDICKTEQLSGLFLHDWLSSSYHEPMING